MLQRRKVAGPGHPLRSLTAVALDTETTSLDIANARVVEIGAVALLDGTLAHNLTFQTHVNPGTAIPRTSTAIHGITDAAVVSAPAFAEAYRSFVDFAGGHLLLGYALGFDLAILRRENEIVGMPWKSPPALDVRDLVRILNPPLPDFSLDKVAAWLDVRATDRHTALGDAICTAEIFLALLPKLRERRIRTLGEAQEACRRQSRIDAENRLPVIEVNDPPLSREGAALAKIDSYPYRHRVRDVMATPAEIVPASTSLRDALRRMMGVGVSSLFVSPVMAGGQMGIITERDILRTIDHGPEAWQARQVIEVASFPLETVADGDFLYRAFGRMRRKKFRHLGVTDESGRLVGALTQRDLLRQRADEAIALTDALGEAAGIGELASVWRKLSEAANALLSEGVAGRDIAGIISGEIQALTARAASMAEMEVSRGLPRPAKLRYAVLVLGSGGRGESLLALDQDNAMVFDGDDEGSNWLAQLAARMNGILDEIGVPFCKGGVMARNAEWRKNLVDWRQKIANWLSRSSPEDILDADIFFDAAPVFGDDTLADTLLADAFAAAAHSDVFLKLMSVNAAGAAPPLGWLRGFKLEEDGRADLKKGGIMPIFSAARVLALQHGIRERSTFARLMAARGKGNAHPRLVDAIAESHQIILTAILHQQIADIARGSPPSNRVDPRQLPETERSQLKWALEQVRSVGGLLGDPLS